MPLGMFTIWKKQMKKRRIENKYIDVIKKTSISVIASPYFFENAHKRRVSLGLVKFVFGIMAQRSYVKESGEGTESKLIITDGFDAILVARISRDEIMLINAFRFDSIKNNSIEIVKVKMPNMIIAASRHFEQRYNKRKIDLALIATVDKQVNTSPINQPFVISDGESTLVAVKKSHTTITLQTCYKNGEIDWDDFLDKKL